MKYVLIALSIALAGCATEKITAVTGRTELGPI